MARASESEGCSYGKTGCESRECDPSTDDCQECIEEALSAIAYSANWYNDDFNDEGCW